ncbi:MAG: acyl-CoA dehydrogenase family protein [Planctomycetota bacterium]|jgi:alkylation response protein AidB-like acyl-CoA dehydrogenase
MNDREELRRRIRAAVEQHVLPGAREADATRTFQRAPLDALAREGLVGAPIPAEFGGGGWSNLDSILVYEETGRVCSSTRGFLAVQVGLVAQCILDWGSEEQKRHWLPGLCSLDAIGCYALTEPEAGSDVSGLKTTASNGRITGEKWWITNGNVADVAIVFARTNPDRHRGLTAFLVTDLDPERMEDMELGHRGSDHARLRFKETPGEVLGREGGGFEVAMTALDHGRLGVAAGAVGVHAACLEEAVRFAQERRQFGRRIGDFQLVQADLADMATELEAARLLCERAARLQDAGDAAARRATSMAKLFCTEAAARAAGKAVVLLGARGYDNRSPVERHYRDIKGSEIYEGTSHIQRLIIGRDLVGPKSRERR